MERPAHHGLMMKQHLASKLYKIIGIWGLKDLITLILNEFVEFNSETMFFEFPVFL